MEIARIRSGRTGGGFPGRSVMPGIFSLLLCVLQPAETSASTTAPGTTTPAGACVDISDIPLAAHLQAGSGAAVSINGEELDSGSVVYQARYSTDGWTGEVSAYGIHPSSGMVLKDNPIWTAAGRLDARDWDTGRLIATYNGSEGVPFRFSELTGSQKTALDPDWASDSTIADERLEYLRGNRTKEMAAGGYFRNRFSLLGDIVHSSPVYEDGVLYVGSNDGMLHALNASDGEELFAYVPDLVFHNLRELTDPLYQHRWFVDLTPTVKDTGSGTFLVGGLGRGGMGCYCLDVSNPSTVLSETALARRVMWEYPRSNTPLDEKLDMGYSCSVPSIVDSTAGWIAIFGNGYGSPNEKAVLFVVDLASGTCIARIDTGAGGCNGLSTPIAVDLNNDRKVDYVYAGDLKGNLWKFDLTASSPSNWNVAHRHGSTPKPLFQARDRNGAPQPVTGRPDVMRHCSRSMPGYIVIFATGKLLGQTDLADFSNQTIYGIWDYGDHGDESEYLGSFERGAGRVLSNQPEAVSLLEQREIYYQAGEENCLRALSGHEPVWVTEPDAHTGQDPDPSSTTPNHAGWFFDLPLSGERVVSDPMIRDGKAIVISNVPWSSLGAAGGISIVNEMDACSGGRSSSARFDVNGDGVIDERDMIEAPDPHNPGQTIRVAPTGTGFRSMIHGPRTLRVPGADEIKYFSSADGDIVTLRKTGERHGLHYWRHVD